MPGYRRYARRSRGGKSKRTYRKRWSRKRKPTGSGESGKRFFKLRGAFALSADAGGTISLSVTDDPSGLGDWSNIAALFDVYKVCAIKVKFIPQLPNDTGTTTGFYPFYLIGDVNTATNPISSITVACQYENMRAKNMYMPWKYYWKCPKQSSTGADIVLANGYRPTSSTTATMGVFGWGQGFDISQQYGSYIVTHYIVAKARR